MTKENLERALRGFYRRSAFRSLLLEFVTGEQLRINHPESLGFDRDLVVYLAPGSGGYRIFDSASVNQLLDIPPA